MTFDLLQHIIVKNNIPMDVKLMSDSGWWMDGYGLYSLCIKKGERRKEYEN